VNRDADADVGGDVHPYRALVSSPSLTVLRLPTAETNKTSPTVYTENVRHTSNREKARTTNNTSLLRKFFFAQHWARDWRALNTVLFRRASACLAPRLRRGSFFALASARSSLTAMRLLSVLLLSLATLSAGAGTADQCLEHDYAMKNCAARAHCLPRLSPAPTPAPRVRRR